MVLISLALFLGGAIFLLNRRARSIDIRSDFDEWAHLVGALKDILVQIQKHRGLTTAFLNSGVGEYRAAIEEKKRLTDRMWISLVAEHPALIEDALYLGITDHWERLKKRWPNRSVDNNIEQHNRLILNLIRLIDCQEEDCPLFADLLREQGLDLSWKALLETVEILGQIRAIGTGVVSSGKSKVIEQNKMIFLVGKAEGQLNKIIDSFELSPIVNNSDEIKYYLSKSTINTNMLCALVVEKFSKTRVQNLSATQFFDLASAAIESLSLLFDSVILALQVEVLSSNSWPVFFHNATQLKPRES